MANLLEFVDEVAVMDDGSTDGWRDLIPRNAPVRVATLAQDGRRDSHPAFFRHALARNELLHFTLDGDPDWVVASDADELFDNGPALRAACEASRAPAL